MTVHEHLLTCLAEECAEITHRTCKALRFGLDDRDPTLPDAQMECVLIKQEITDLFAVVELLMEHGIITPALERTEIEAKKDKVRHFLDYARNNGVLR